MRGLAISCGWLPVRKQISTTCFFGELTVLPPLYRVWSIFLGILEIAIRNWKLNIGVSGKYSSLGKSDSAERISMPWYLGNFFSALHCLPLHCTALWDISKVFRIQIELLSPSLTTAGGDQLRKDGERGGSLRFNARKQDCAATLWQKKVPKI